MTMQYCPSWNNNGVSADSQLHIYELLSAQLHKTFGMDLESVAIDL